MSLNKRLQGRSVTDLDPQDFQDHFLDEEVVMALLRKCDAVWIHNGDPQNPHAELTSGLCSNGYFNLSKVTQHPNVVAILARQLIKDLRTLSVPLDKVDWVVGSPYAAITFSYEVAMQLGARHGFCEKDKDDPRKMIWKRSQIPEGEDVLQIEELITTSSTTKKVRKAVIEGNEQEVHFLPVVGTIVHRPPEMVSSYNINGEDVKVVSLLQQEIWAIEPKDCSLCQAGSEPLRPKDNWAELTGKK